MLSCTVPRINTYLSVVVSFTLRTITYRLPSRVPVSKVTHILSYRRNIIKILSNTYTFEKVRGSLLKYIEKTKRRCFCIEIESASLQRLKGSNKIGYRNRHHSMVLRTGLKNRNRQQLSCGHSIPT